MSPIEPLLPPFGLHAALREHDEKNGSTPFLGGVLHWLKSWLIFPPRKMLCPDVIVCGSNPVLGFFASCAYSRSGNKVLWIKDSRNDYWDYPLATSGAHDDLFAKADLPGFGPELFSLLASECASSVWIADGFCQKYAFEAGNGALLSFLEPCEDQSRTWGDARCSCEAMVKGAFNPVSLGPSRKELLAAAATSVMVSDVKDGVGRASSVHGLDPRRIRLGRAAWHTQEAGSFARRSREDLKAVLELGGWI